MPSENERSMLSKSKEEIFLSRLHYCLFNNDAKKKANFSLKKALWVKLLSPNMLREGFFLLFFPPKGGF